MPACFVITCIFYEPFRNPSYTISAHGSFPGDVRWSRVGAGGGCQLLSAPGGLQADVWENVAGGMFREWQFTHALWPQGLFPKIALFLGNPDNGGADFSALHSHLDKEIQLCHSLRNYLISSGLLKSPAKQRQNIPNIAISVCKPNDYHYFKIQVLDTTLFII